MHTGSPGAALVPARALTVKERALWMLHRLVPGSGVSNEALAFHVSGRLDASVLDAQLHRLVRRHPALRTVFPELRGEPMALVLPPARVRTALRVVERPAAPWPEELAAFAGAPFDLLREIPVRAGLFRFDDGDVFCVVLHHLAYDAWTAGVVFGDIVDGYNAATAPAGAVEPSDVDGRSGFTEPASTADELTYWESHLAGVDTGGQRLEIGRPDPADPSFAGAGHTHDFSPAARQALTGLSRRLRVTDNMILLAAYCLLLARHGVSTDRVVGVSVDARDATHRSVVGYHVNTLPMRVRVDLDAGFDALVATVRDVFLGGLTHRATPYEAVLPALPDVGLDWRTPLFRHMYNYRPVPVPEKSTIGGLPVRMLGVETGYSRQDLEFIVESGQGVDRIRIVYSTEIFSIADVTALAERYDSLLVALAADPAGPLGEVPVWTGRDRAVVATANDTGGGRVATVAAQVAAAADARAADAAVLDGDTAVTYGDLLGRAAAIHADLVGCGVGHGSVVGLLGDRGADLAAATLAVWAAGAAYLPLPVDSPTPLLQYELDDAKVAAVLADRPLPEGVEVACPVLPLVAPGRDGAGGSNGAMVDRLRAVSQDDRAYVIYTSGSTGRPKGVELTHANLANVVRHFADDLEMAPGTGMLWLTSFSFDISALELFLPLSVGGGVVVAPDRARADLPVALDLVERHDVAVIQATPTTWAGIGATGRSLAGRRVLCGGEPMTAALAAALLATGCRLWNVYGPTETTIWSTAMEIDTPPTDPVPVGAPIRDTAVFVADAAGRPVPPGVTGELCIAGSGVATGYLNRPDLTDERFAGGAGVGRHYRTGDRARWRYDGVLELRGRTDRQVKIRSHRLELGQVEAALSEDSAVEVAAVVLRTDLPEHERLVAFVQLVTSTDDTVVERVWRDARHRLPPYALPGRIVVGPVPVNANGKVDYPALDRVPIAAGDPASTAPAGHGDDPLVTSFVDLWREIVDDPGLGPTDNFFLSGGHSLLAVRLLARTEETTGVRMSLTALLDAPTPQEFAHAVAERTAR